MIREPRSGHDPGRESTPGAISLILRPRRTMRWVLADDPNQGVMWISMFAGITFFLRVSVLHGLHPVPLLVGWNRGIDQIISYGIGATPSPTFLVVTVLLLGALGGAISLYAMAAILWLSGRIFGGNGSYERVRSALAWAVVPYIWILPLWIGYALLNAGTLRMTAFSYGELMPFEDHLILLVLVVLDWILRGLCVVWLVLKLTVAQRLPLLRAALAVALALAPVAVLVYLVRQV